MNKEYNYEQIDKDKYYEMLLDAELIKYKYISYLRKLLSNDHTVDLYSDDDREYTITLDGIIFVTIYNTDVEICISIGHYDDESNIQYFILFDISDFNDIMNNNHISKLLPPPDYDKMTPDEIQLALNKAIQDEDYEKMELLRPYL